MPHAVDDAAGGKRFNGSLVGVIFDIRECCAGRAHSGDADGCIGAAFFDGGAGLCGILRDIAHAVQAVLAVFRTVDGNEGIEALLGGHLVIAI